MGVITNGLPKVTWINITSCAEVDVLSKKELEGVNLQKTKWFTL